MTQKTQAKELNQHFISEISKLKEINSGQVKPALELLILEECSIPFVTRYRKEKTGGLDEVQLEEIKSSYEDCLEREKRREYIFSAIDKQGLMTDSIKNLIHKATTLNQLEDIYSPYKQKKKSKGQKAKEAGLSPLVEEVIKGISSHQYESLLKTYLNPEKDVKSEEDVKQGVMSIISEMISHDPTIKETLRKDYWREAHLKSSVKKDAQNIQGHDKYKDYFDFEQKINQLSDKKTAHRFLAIRRGMVQKILKVEVTFDFDMAITKIKNLFYQNQNIKSLPTEDDIILPCIKKAYQFSIHPSLDLEIKGELKTLSDQSAIEVFGVNLKNLLLLPYLGPKTVIGIDPGIRTGCKVAVVKETGELVVDTVIFPEGSQNERQKSIQVIDALIEQFKANHIAIGNGTNGRKTLKFIKQNVQKVKEKKVVATLVNEDGASIYSTSEIARKEFPDKDPTVRGAVSIARRFQDPLAELVKIDPKSIGVGQYQHDVSQSKLKKALGSVVENCVNYVGVDLNTASSSLLSYVSGIGPALADNIIKHRYKKGRINKRDELLKVARFNEKTFQQAAGFLRIYDGDHPLDQTNVHPEQYELIEQWLKTKNKSFEELLKNKDLILEFEKDDSLKEKMGPFTHQDVASSLRNPRQDPRSEFEGQDFSDDLTTIEDLRPGSWYPGVITNITQFGAFVDLGIKENGLLHVSQMADRFVSDPLKEVQVGQSLKVRVIDIDHERKRISLSLKKEEKNEPHHSPREKSSNKNKKLPRENSDQKLVNNPFSVLKNFKS